MDYSGLKFNKVRNIAAISLTIFEKDQNEGHFCYDLKHTIQIQLHSFCCRFALVLGYPVSVNYNNLDSYVGSART